MIETKKIALLVDVDNVKIGGEAFNELYSKLNDIGEVVYCKFYGYNDRKHIYLSDAITKFGYETAPFMRYKKRFSQLDIRIIVDAIKLNYTKTEIDTYCIVAGDGDLIPLLVELKTSGRTLIDINTPYQEQNYHMFDAHINLVSLGMDVETYQPKSKKSSSITKKTPVKPIEKSGSSYSKTTKTTETEEISRTVKAHQKADDKNANALKPQEIVVDESLFEKDAEPAVEEIDTGINDNLGEILRDITNRYTELDFSNNDDMPKKLQLIKDIENLIETETNKGEGLKSSNEEVKQIFVELQNIVEDMKNAI